MFLKGKILKGKEIFKENVGEGSYSPLPHDIEHILPSVKCIFYQYELCAELLYSLTFPCIGMFFLQNEAEHKWMWIILNGEWKMFCYIITCKLRSFLLNMEFILGKRSSSVSHVQLFCDRKDCSPLGSSVHGILQAILEWVDISFSRGSSWPRDQTRVSCIAGRFSAVWATRKTPLPPLSSLCSSCPHSLPVLYLVTAFPYLYINTTPLPLSRVVYSCTVSKQWLTYSFCLSQIWLYKHEEWSYTSIDHNMKKGLSLIPWIPY